MTQTKTSVQLPVRIMWQTDPEEDWHWLTKVGELPLCGLRFVFEASAAGHVGVVSREFINLVRADQWCIDLSQVIPTGLSRVATWARAEHRYVVRPMTLGARVRPAAIQKMFGICTCGKTSCALSFLPDLCEV